jgi:hypothetical protein
VGTRGAHNDSRYFFLVIGKPTQASLPVCNAILTGSQPTFLPVPRDCGCEPSLLGLLPTPSHLVSVSMAPTERAHFGLIT